MQVIWLHPSFFSVWALHPGHRWTVVVFIHSSNPLSIIWAQLFPSCQGFPHLKHNSNPHSHFICVVNWSPVTNNPQLGQGHHFLFGSRLTLIDFLNHWYFSNLSFQTALLINSSVNLAWHWKFGHFKSNTYPSSILVFRLYSIHDLQ